MLNGIERVFILLVMSAFISDMGYADEYPTQPITIVVGFGVGGSADRMARIMAPYISEELGQPVHVVNRLGAGTLLAANYVLAQPSDGYTIFASAFAPYLFTTILEGNARYKVTDFSFINAQWFDEDIIALSKRSRFEGMVDLLTEIRERPKTVRGAVVRGSAGHLMAKLLLEVNGIPETNLNLVTYNSGGMARAAVAGGVVDFIIVSAEGTESIREYIEPLAVVSNEQSNTWGVPPVNNVLTPLNVQVPILQGSIRGFAMTTEFKNAYPERFDKLANAMEKALQNDELKELLARVVIGGDWTGPDASDRIMRESFEVFSRYADSL